MFFAPKTADARLWRTSLVRKMAAMGKAPALWLRTYFMDSPLYNKNLRTAVIGMDLKGGIYPYTYSKKKTEF